MISANEALERLRRGNREFVESVRNSESLADRSPTAELIAEQLPFATILGCSDSRVPAEIIFNQGLGDLFVIRVAGNIAAPSQIGSVEFAALKFGTPLTVVLGHTGCGAIQATLEELQRPSENQSPNLRAIVDPVRPSVEKLLLTELRHDHVALARAAVRANVAKSVGQLQDDSDVLRKLISEGQLMIVGAEYSLETGEVEFLEDTAIS